MKIKTKLVISFCMTLFVPLLLAGIAFFFFSRMQGTLAGEEYGTETMESYLPTGSFRMLTHITEDEYELLKKTAGENPDRLMDRQWLGQRNLLLEGKFSYIVVKKGGELIYNGGKDNDNELRVLPEAGLTAAKNKTGAYLDSKEQVLVRQVGFTLDDGSRGNAYIVTSTRQTSAEVRKLYIRIAAAIILILLVTAAMLVAWTYGSIVTPIRKLRNGAEKIKDGKLDFSLDVSGEDEIGELGVAFEEMRQRLKENAEEKLNNEKENRVLVSNIAHDLKTPITALKGYAEGILDGVANTPEKVDKYVRTIYNKATEMDTLINELTLYAKIDTNRIPYNFARINAAQYFQDCVEELGMDLEEKNIVLHYDNYAAGETEIIADPEQLRRVVHNIIGNSVKYMNKDRGEIGIRVRDAGDFIQVEMEDNGSGIARKDIPYVFDRFYRADASRNSATGGSGIGLSIVSKIISDHGGRIWVTSREGQGTTMYFVLRKYIREGQENEQNSDR